MSPYAPPSEHQPSMLPAFISWFMAGAVFGGGVGALGAITGQPIDAGSGALIGLLLGAFAGYTLSLVERKQSQLRTKISTATGRKFVPVHGWLFVAAAGTTALGIALLVFAAIIALENPALPSAFLLTAVPLFAAGRAWSKHRLNIALERLEEGDLLGGITTLDAVRSGRFSSKSTRRIATTNLALLQLSAGNLSEAALLFSQLSKGQTATMAGIGLSLIRLLQGNKSACKKLLAAAINSPDGKMVQHQADAVRLMLITTTDGPIEALRWGRSISSPTTPMFRWVLSQLKEASGDLEGALELRADSQVMAFCDMGLAKAISKAAANQGWFNKR